MGGYSAWWWVTNDLDEIRTMKNGERWNTAFGGEYHRINDPNGADVVHVYGPDGSHRVFHIS